jgi:GDP-L-fucose synthase
MKILIFGSNGLVGSSVSKILSSSGNSFTLVSSTRKDTNLFSLENTKATISEIAPDVVVNAAAKVGGIVANNTLRTEFLLENLKINMNILESCIKFPNIKIINLGSSCIYPLGVKNPIKENSIMTGSLEPTNSPYSMAKLSAIELGKSMNTQFGSKVINLMPTNLYGPNDNFNPENSHVIPGLIHKMNIAKENEEINFSIWGSGSPLREFLYVDDLAKAIEFIIINDINVDLLNVGSGEEISIKDLASLIQKVVNYKGNLTFDNSQPDGNPRKLLDSGIINQLGWKSTVSLEKGLIKTYDWYMSNRDKIKT